MNHPQLIMNVKSDEIVSSYVFKDKLIVATKHELWAIDIETVSGEPKLVKIKT